MSLQNIKYFPSFLVTYFFTISSIPSTFSKYLFAFSIKLDKYCFFFSSVTFSNISSLLFISFINEYTQLT